jgi:hypothetical protein
MSESEVVPTPTLNGVRAALSKPKVTVSDVLKVARPDADKLTLAETPVPKDPGLNEAAWDAIEKVAGLLGVLELPNRRRMLSAAELEEITRVYEQLQLAMKGLDNSRDQIKAATFNHFDAVALDDGNITVDTKFTKEGWAVVDDRESAKVEGLDKVLTREVSGGKLELTVEALSDLVEDEKITQKDFLEMTRQIRVRDEERTLSWLRRNPEKAEILAEAIQVGKSSAAFWLRDA